MENGKENTTDLRIEQVKAEMLEFTREVSRKSQGDGRLTLNEMEKLLSALRSKTDSIYLDLMSDMIAETDEKEMIKSKKENAGSKE